MKRPLGLHSGRGLVCGNFSNVFPDGHFAKMASALNYSTECRQLSVDARRARTQPAGTARDDGLWSTCTTRHVYAAHVGLITGVLVRALEPACQ